MVMTLLGAGDEVGLDETDGEIDGVADFVGLDDVVGDCDIEGVALGAWLVVGLAVVGSSVGFSDGA